MVQETGREPYCSHCFKKAYLTKSAEIFTKKDMRSRWGYMYFCRDCRAWCRTSGVRPLGTPATDDLHALRDEVKDKIKELIDMKVARDKVHVSVAAQACHEWVEKSLGMDYDANRIGPEDASRLDQILTKTLKGLKNV